MAYTVPNVAGVPALYGGLSSVASVPAISSLADTLLPNSLAPMWGIFLDGFPVVVADSVISMDARQEAVIADFPLEGGTFESYDKVDRPFDVRFRFSAGGNDANRASLFASVKALFADKQNQYMFIAPEDVFENVTVSHYDYHRTSVNGLGLVTIDVWGWQLLVGNSTIGTGNNSQSVGAASQSNSGAVQPQAISPTGAFTGAGSLGYPAAGIPGDVSSSSMFGGGFSTVAPTSSLSLQ